MDKPNKLKELTAPCGLYCAVCPIYQAQTDRALAEKVAARLGLPVEDATCSGCRPQQGKVVVMGKQFCETYQCVTGRKLDFCYQCPDFPCLKLAPSADRANEIPHNTKIYNLLLIQKKGLKHLAQEAGDLRRTYFRGKKVRPGAEPQL